MKRCSTSLIIQSESEVAQSCLTLCSPIAYQGLPSSMGFSSQELEWVAISFSISLSTNYKISLSTNYQINTNQNCNEVLPHINQNTVVTKSCLTLCDPMDCRHQASLSFTISKNFLRLMPIELMMLSKHLNFCWSLLLLPSISPSIRVFSSELALDIRWPKNWKFSFSISHSNKYSGFISFRIDWCDLLAVQGNLKSLLQHKNLKASIIQCLAFFSVQLSNLYDY